VQERRGEPEENEGRAGSDREDAGHVAPAELVDGDVGDVRPAVDECEHAEDDRDCGPKPMPQLRERDDRGDPRDEGEERRERVLPELNAGLPVEERVVERM
jgi:hypothetical protein